ncbi:MAG TPA: DNA-directed RNA polymerase subunit L [archaeon]|nr:DNA-directed RNA polymerase subunit L [archaeon]
MELKILKQDEKTLMLEVEGETVALTNLLRQELLEDKNVDEAAQIKEHPYLAEPKIFVKTERGSPVTALEKASERIQSQLAEFREKFKAAVKK